MIIGPIMYNFPPWLTAMCVVGQSNLNQKIHSIVSSLQEIDRCKHLFGDVTVPMNVLQYIDQGTNPQLYTKDLMERVLAKNEEVKGKIEVYQQFHDSLSEELDKAFPNLISDYKFTRQQLQSDNET